MTVSGTAWWLMIRVQELERNKSLVVVHGNHRIEPAAPRFIENGVRRVRAGNFSSLSKPFLGICHRGSDDFQFLMAE